VILVRRVSLQPGESDGSADRAGSAGGADRAGSADGADQAGSAGGGAPRSRSYTWEDPALSAAAARELDGKEFLEAILAGSLPGAPVASTLDFVPVSVQPGTVVFEFRPAEFHYNPIGSVHGGVIATLCDSACGCAVQSMLPAGTYYTSLDLSVKFLRPVSSASGPMTCEGTVTHLGGRSALAQARLTDSAGVLHAHATSSCMVFRPPAQPAQQAQPARQAPVS
jgi:uncharacterized protein (TIGR00369 family)